MTMLKNLLAVVSLWMLVCVTASAGNVTYIYTDPQGTLLAEADANGNITATFDYKPFGSQVLGNASNGPGYVGHVNDVDVGLIYMQARYYDPSVGRFLSLDANGPRPGDNYNFNGYTYAKNDPIMYFDPDGREPNPAFHPWGWLPDIYGGIKDALTSFTNAIRSRTSVDAVATEAWGGGSAQTKGLYHSSDAISLILIGEGLEASVDGKFRLLRFNLPNSGRDSHIRINANISMHVIVGGKVQIEVDPAGAVSVYAGLGAGLGESFNFVELSKDVGESSQESDGDDSNQETIRDYSRPNNVEEDDLPRVHGHGGNGWGSDDGGIGSAYGLIK